MRRRIFYIPETYKAFVYTDAGRLWDKKLSERSGYVHGCTSYSSGVFDLLKASLMYLYNL